VPDGLIVHCPIDSQTEGLHEIIYDAMGSFIEAYPGCFIQSRSFSVWF
jgi:hypothetical protein